MKHLFIFLPLALAACSSNASAQGYAYDDAGRLSKALYPDGHGVSYTYDIRDNLSQITPILVPPSPSSLLISTVGVGENQAQVSWQFTGTATGFLVQTKTAGIDLWVDHTTVGSGLRAATVSNPQRLDIQVRVIALGSTVDTSSAPSASVRFPLGVPRLVTIAADENDHALGLGKGDSLREVIEASFAGDIIRFAPVLSGQTFLLTEGQIRIDKTLTIDASISLAEGITLDPADASRALFISGSVNVILNRMSFTRGSSTAGGAIHNDGATLNLRRCTFSLNNSQSDGGALFVASGNILIDDGCVFDRNMAEEGGGAVYVSVDSQLVVDGAIFTRNEAGAEGGAIHGNGASCDIRNASFSSNGAETGGALFHRDGSALVINSTLAFNSSSADAGGGAAVRGSCLLTLRYCTVTANVGAGAANADSGSVTLENTILSGNFNTLNSGQDFSGSYTAVGANLLRLSTGNTRLAGPAPLTSDPLLGSLNTSGVMPLLSGSPAIDAGVTDANTPSTDQERSFRPFGAAPDLGASEAKLSAITDVLWLSTSAGQIFPRFDSTVLSYSASVPESVASAAVRAAKVQNNQTLQSRINGGSYTTLGSKEASPKYPLEPGVNLIEVKVIAPNGTTNQTYGITVTSGESESSNVGIQSISTTTGTVSPAFDPTVKDYFLSVPEGTAATSITAPPAQPGSTVAVRVNFGDYVPLTAGSPSASLPLHAGDNSIEIQVTDESGAVTAEYSLTVTRQPAAATTPTSLP